MPRTTDRLRRLSGIGIAATGIVCPCHVLSAAVLSVGALLLGSAPDLRPEAQDGIHALYLPFAVSLGAWLISRRARSKD